MTTTNFWIQILNIQIQFSLSITQVLMMTALAAFSMKDQLKWKNCELAKKHMKKSNMTSGHFKHTQINNKNKHQLKTVQMNLIRTVLVSCFESYCLSKDISNTMPCLNIFQKKTSVIILHFHTNCLPTLWNSQYHLLARIMKN